MGGQEKEDIASTGEIRNIATIAEISRVRYPTLLSMAEYANQSNIKFPFFNNTSLKFHWRTVNVFLSVALHFVLCVEYWLLLRYLFIYKH